MTQMKKVKERIKNTNVSDAERKLEKFLKTKSEVAEKNIKLWTENKIDDDTFLDYITKYNIAHDIINELKPLLKGGK